MPDDWRERDANAFEGMDSDHDGRLSRKELQGDAAQAQAIPRSVHPGHPLWCYTYDPDHPVGYCSPMPSYWFPEQHTRRTPPLPKKHNKTRAPPQGQTAYEDVSGDTAKTEALGDMRATLRFNAAALPQARREMSIHLLDAKTEDVLCESQGVSASEEQPAPPPEPDYVEHTAAAMLQQEPGLDNDKKTVACGDLPDEVVLKCEGSEAYGFLGTVELTWTYRGKPRQAIVCTGTSPRQSAQLDLTNPKLR